MPVAEPAASGYPAAGYNCGTGGYTAGGYYGPAGCGSSGAYPEVSGYFGESCNDNQWFGGVYFLYMERDEPSDVRLMVEIDHNVAPDPYYPPKSMSVMSTHDADYGFRPGMEVRLGSTFTVGDSCNSCDSGYGYGGCNGCARLAPGLRLHDVCLGSRLVGY